MKKEHFNSGENNGMWKGDNVGYNGLHTWVRKRKKKPLLCEKCKTRKAVDLSNISGKYLRDINDFEYLCRKCHMDLDGRNERLRQSGKSRKLPDQKCLMCGKMFHRDVIGKYCSRKCFSMCMWDNRPRKKIKTKICKICNKKFICKSPTMITCCSSCGTKYSWKTRRINKYVNLHSHRYPLFSHQYY